eukprot:41033-Eustigmatos_ZCMA.PRE.1
MPSLHDCFVTQPIYPTSCSRCRYGRGCAIGVTDARRVSPGALDGIHPCTQRTSRVRAWLQNAVEVAFDNDSKQYVSWCHWVQQPCDTNT